MNINDIKELIKEFDSSSLSELNFSDGDKKIELKKSSAVVATTVSNPVTVQTAPQKEVSPIADLINENIVPIHNAINKESKNLVSSKEENLVEIKSPMVGTFYASASPETPVYVKVGDKVNKDTVVAIVEAMKLFNEIEAEVNGEIVEVLVQNGQLVEYGQPLFRVRP